MELIILPLLVASQLDLQNEVWKYGPIVVYNVTYSAEIIPHLSSLKDPDVEAMAFQNQLKCRPRTPKILNCHLDHLNMKVRLANTTEFQPVARNSDKGQDFEIRFDEMGISDIVVPSSITPKSLDMLRAIANQFHIGLDMSKRMEGIEESWENFTTGNCMAKYEVKLENPKDFFTRKTFHHQRFPRIWSPDVRTVIKKTRNVEKCRVLAPYFFSSNEGFQENSYFNILLKSSTSSIIADPVTFESSTETEIELNHEEDIIVMHENMTVTFDSLIPAKQKIPSILKPASAGIITGKWLHDDEFSSESEENLKQ